MKDWPKDKNETVYVDHLLDPLHSSLLAAIAGGPSVYFTGIPYDGYNIARQDLVASYSPEERLTAESLTWWLEGQGKDVYSQILLIAFQLGVEQGRRDK